MELTTNQIIDAYKAFNELRGQATEVPDEKGTSSIVVHKPYPLSEKVKWNGAKNREKFKRIVVAHDEVVLDKKTELDTFKRLEMRKVNAEVDEKVRAEKQKRAMEAIQDKVDEMNAYMRTIGRATQEVEGLLTMPAAGFYLKTSDIPLPLLSELQFLIDGLPDFEDEKEPTKK